MPAVKLIAAIACAAVMTVNSAASFAAEKLVISSWAPPTHGMNAIMWPRLIKMMEEATDGRVSAEIKYKLAPPPAQFDLVQAEQQFYAETARIGMTQAMRFPSFSITGAAGLASSDLSTLLSSDDLMYSVGGSILGPIFNWGKNKRRVDIQKETARQALYSYEQAVLNAFREVDDALIDVDTYTREVNSRERQKQAASHAAMLSRARYDGGQTAYLEVLDTERSLFNAELETSAVKGALLSSYLYLYKALGGGWITEAERLEQNEANGD